MRKLSHLLSLRNADEPTSCLGTCSSEPADHCCHWWFLRCSSTFRQFFQSAQNTPPNWRPKVLGPDSGAGHTSRQPRRRWCTLTCPSFQAADASVLPNNKCCEQVCCLCVFCFLYSLQERIRGIADDSETGGVVLVNDVVLMHVQRGGTGKAECLCVCAVRTADKCQCLKRKAHHHSFFSIIIVVFIVLSCADNRHRRSSHSFSSPLGSLALSCLPLASTLWFACWTFHFNVLLEVVCQLGHFPLNAAVSLVWLCRSWLLQGRRCRRRFALLTLLTGAWRWTGGQAFRLPWRHAHLRSNGNLLLQRRVLVRFYARQLYSRGQIRRQAKLGLVLWRRRSIDNLGRSFARRSLATSWSFALWGSPRFPRGRLCLSLLLSFHIGQSFGAKVASLIWRTSIVAVGFIAVFTASCVYDVDD